MRAYMLLCNMALKAVSDMAIYHLNVKIISRSQGRSVVACAAYRAGEKLYDERLDKVHDYRHKKDVAHTEILLSENASDWMKNRERLWNHVEAIEKRKDAQLAREVEISLPRELTLEQNRELARVFVQKIFVDEGMVADLCIHMDVGSDGECQPHAHVLLSLRDVNEERFGLKNTDWNQKERLLEWRESWESCANHHLALHGHDICIDHRSYVDQKINLEPQHKIGPLAAQEKRTRLEDHQRIAYENGERLYHDPMIAFDALTRQQSTFTHRDLSRLVNRHTRDAEQFQQVYEKVKACSEMVPLGKDERGEMRFTTQEMLSLETRMLDGADALHKRQDHAVRERFLTLAIQSRTLTEEQQVALNSVTEAGDLKCMVGYAGSGKSYLLGAAREVWEASGYRVRGVSLSGIATQSLEQSSGIKSRTVASQLYRWNRDQDRLTSWDVLVIDEAGMLGSRQMERLITEAQQSGAKVVAVGDWQQLQAIEAGASFRAMAERHPYVELRAIRRQKSQWQKEATVELAQGQVKEALERYRRHDHVHMSETQQDAKKQLMAQWNDVRHTCPQESQMIMAYTRQDVKDLNDMARALKKEDGELGMETSFKMERGERAFATEDRVYFLKGDRNLDVVNGTLGTIRKIEGRHIQIEVDSDQPEAKKRQVWVDTETYTSLDHGYAATVYKAQGLTVDRSYLLTSCYDDAHSTYVGLTRHRLSCDVFGSHEVFKNDRELVYTLGRDRTKDVTLDYTKSREEYARQRSIHPEAYSFSLEQRFQHNLSHYEQQAQTFLKRVDQQEKKQFTHQTAQLAKIFRQRCPDRAREITEQLQPEMEKQAIAYAQKLKSYNREVLGSRHSLEIRRSFQDATEQMVNTKSVMNYFQHRFPELADHMKKVVKGAQEQKELEQLALAQRQKALQLQKAMERRERQKTTSYQRKIDIPLQKEREHESQKGHERSDDHDHEWSR